MVSWKRRRLMNIGPLDRRRIVRRCEQCRISRTKCEGGRPCNACRARFTACRDQTHHGATQREITSPDMPIVLVNPAESQLLSTTASLDNVYRFVGTLPSPITDLFSTDMLLRLFQENKSIRAALLQIGDAYVTNGGQQMQSPKGSMLMDIKQRKLYATIQTRLQKSDSHLDPCLLLLAVLFCLLQLMTTRSCNISLQIVDQVNTSIVQRHGPDGFLTKFDKSTLLLFRLLEGVGNLIRDQDTTFADAKWCKTTNDRGTSGLPITREPDTFLFECILTFISLLADINIQSIAWLSQESHFARMAETHLNNVGYTDSICNEDSTYAKHLATGQNIIQRASELLESMQRFEGAVVGSKSVHDTCYDMFMAYSFCLRIGTLRLFADPLWQNAPFSREGLKEWKVQAYVQSGLNHVENRLQHAGLEAVFYIQHLVLIGIEVADLASRDRIMSLLKKIRSRGFVFAEVYIADLQLAWQVVPATEYSDTSE